MLREIVKIDEEKCDGCGQCVTACVDGAIEIVDGKARLASESYCDGLGACLGECPRDAITVQEREAAPFDEEATKRHLAQSSKPSPGHGCPGAAPRSIPPRSAQEASVTNEPAPSGLANWPVQLMLVPPRAPFLKGADLLICADCVPFALGDFHSRFLRGRVVLVGCPKLDDIDYYREKIEAIITEAEPRSVTVLRMEVPCCGALARAVTEAVNAVALHVPLEVHTIGIEGAVVGRDAPADK